MFHKKAINRQLNTYLAQKRKATQRHAKRSWLEIFGFKKKKQESDEVPIEDLKRTLIESGVDVSYLDALEKNKVKKMDETISVNEAVNAIKEEPTLATQATAPASPVQPIQEQKKEDVSTDSIRDELEDAADELEKELEASADETSKESFFQKLGRMFSFGKKKDLKSEYEAADAAIEKACVESLDAKEIVVNDEQLRDDLRKSLKITFDVMQRLPQAQLDRYKESEHFKEYKKLLDKHKIKQL